MLFASVTWERPVRILRSVEEAQKFFGLLKTGEQFIRYNVVRAHQPWNGREIDTRLKFGKALTFRKLSTISFRIAVTSSRIKPERTCTMHLNPLKTQKPMKRPIYFFGVRHWPLSSVAIASNITAPTVKKIGDAMGVTRYIGVRAFYSDDAIQRMFDLSPDDMDALERIATVAVIDEPDSHQG